MLNEMVCFRKFIDRKWSADLKNYVRVLLGSSDMNRSAFTINRES